MSDHSTHDVGDMMTCGTCEREWCGLCTPTPAARCPFEYEHEELEEDEAPKVSDSDRLAHAASKVTQWIASLEANAAHDMKRDYIASARAMSARADDLRAVLAILDGSDDDYIIATGAFRR